MKPIQAAVLGGGNMGTAMAHALAGHGHEVAVWDHFPGVAEDIRHRRENRRFLPGIRLHPRVLAATSIGECVAGASLVLTSVPSAFLVATLARALPSLPPDAVLLNVAKGFAPRTRQPLLATMARVAPGHACVHLAGPAIANELARGVPASVVLASADEPSARRVAAWLAGPSFIPDTTADVTGAALGGILKNVYAILLGALETLGGDARNLEAAFLAASVREMAEIASAQGGQSSTIYGLAGLGDLVATGFSRDSHNRGLGRLLATGKTASELEREQGWLPEGARATTAVCALARAGEVSAPLAGWVRRTLDGSRPTIAGLMRALRAANRSARENTASTSPEELP